MPGDPAHLHRPSSATCILPTRLGSRRLLYAGLAMIGGACVFQRLSSQQISPQVTTVAPIVFSTTSFSEGPSSGLGSSLVGNKAAAADQSAPPPRTRSRRRHNKRNRRRRDVAEEDQQDAATGGEKPPATSQVELPQPPAAEGDKVPPPPAAHGCKEPLPAIKSCLDQFLEAPVPLNGARGARGVIETTSGGQFGNQAFVIAMAAVLGEKLDYGVRVQEAWDYVPWTVSEGSQSKDQCRSWTTLSDSNFCQTLKELPAKVLEDGHCITIKDGYFQRFSLFASSMPLVRRVLASPDCVNHDSPDPNDLVIHVRFLGFQPRVYHNVPLATVEQVRKADFYGQLDPGYYDKIIQSRSYDKVWVVCDEHTREAPLVHYLESKHSAAVRSSRGWWEDYTFLSNAKHLVLPISTFSWWAAVLNNATEVHFPLAALWHPSNPHHLETFESELAGSVTVYGPEYDDRFIYHDLVERAWFGRYDSCTNTFSYRERDEEIAQEARP